MNQDTYKQKNIEKPVNMNSLLKKHKIKRSSYTKKLDELVKLGYSDTQAQQVIFCKRREKAIYALRGIHRLLTIRSQNSTEKNQSSGDEWSHEDILDILSTNGGITVLNTIRAYARKLQDSGFQMQQIKRIIICSKSPNILKTLVESKDFLLDLGCSKEEIADMAGQTSGDKILDAIKKHSKFFIDFGVSIEGIVQLATQNKASDLDSISQYIAQIIALQSTLTCSQEIELIKQLTTKIVLKFPASNSSPPNLGNLLARTKSMLESGFTLLAIQKIAVRPKGMQRLILLEKHYQELIEKGLSQQKIFKIVSSKQSIKTIEAILANRFVQLDVDEDEDIAKEAPILLKQSDEFQNEARNTVLSQNPGLMLPIEFTQATDPVFDERRDPEENICNKEKRPLLSAFKPITFWSNPVNSPLNKRKCDASPNSPVKKIHYDMNEASCFLMHLPPLELDLLSQPDNQYRYA